MGNLVDRVDLAKGTPWAGLKGSVNTVGRHKNRQRQGSPEPKEPQRCHVSHHGCVSIRLDSGFWRVVLKLAVWGILLSEFSLKVQKPEWRHGE